MTRGPWPATGKKQNGTPSLAPSGHGPRATAHLLARLLVGGVLCYAGFMKAVAPTAEFAAAIEAYHLFPPGIIHAAAFALPWVEMWVGTFLIFGFEVRKAGAASAFLFGLFLAIILSSLARGMDLASCGCFGGDLLSPRHTLVMDIFLFAFSLALATFRPQKPLLSLDL